jgi:O-antigen ligase
MMTRTANGDPGAPRTRESADTAAALLLIAPFIVAAFVDLPRLIRAGSVTALGMLTVAQLMLAGAALVVSRSYPKAVIQRFIPYGFFLAWMILRSAAEVPHVNQGGMQNGMAYLLFGGEFVLAGTLMFHRPAAAIWAIEGGFKVLDIVTMTLVAVSFLLFGMGGNAWLIGPRSVALLAIVPISWHLAGWCHGRTGAGFRALAWTGAIVLSLSRTALAVALIGAALAFLAGGRIRPLRLVSRVPALVVAGLVLLVMLLPFQSQFYDRFFTGGNEVEVAGLTINAAGRNHIWPVVIESAMRHPIIGAGLGSSQNALQDFDSETVGHPHNDYLRVWHDGGLIGVSFLVIALLYWLVGLGRQWFRIARQASAQPHVDLAAFLTLLGIMLASITDNGLVYTFVMTLSGLMVGAAFGLQARRDSTPANSRHGKNLPSAA